MTENEYQQKIESLEKKVENQRIHIQALELLQEKNRNIIIALRKTQPQADFFGFVRYDVQKMRELVERMEAHINGWEVTAERMVGYDSRRED